MTDHGAAPDKDVVSQSNTGVDMHLVHDEAIVTMHTPVGRPESG